MDTQIEKVISILEQNVFQLEATLEEWAEYCKETIDLVEYKNKKSQIKEINKLIKQLKNGTK